MATPLPRSRSTLVSDLLGRLESVAAEPDIRVEEYLDDGRYVIRADLPGISPDKDVDLTIDGDLLRLRGERRAETHERHRTEIRYGTFERILRLPPGSRPEDIKADYTRGVLTVSVPVGTAATPTAIPITHSEQEE